MPTVKETIDAFDRQNGNECIRIGDWLYFSNGAKRDANPYGVLYDPPSDEFLRLKHIEMYREELLRRAINALERQRENFLAEISFAVNHGYHPPYSQEDVKQELEPLIKEVRRLQRHLREIQRKLEAMPSEVEKRHAEASRAFNRSQGESVLAVLRSIKI
ncbi:hypothetical protein Psta_2247 [Pirellula staleyi DSM 6068]|uniref:Uncharacterized protein n=1 Tax=Pirellula staleyi (strain ATCC 27377 / DSM 6068 / ICPB 4128) TaxID=530564 RepID=D2R2S8_PIRSD|nr:hypothetical protein [Pirellula staleyi]ADB16918.1 hypothetical protein Psta_2247 [Pirellula staleyi DSM 6068]